MLCVFEIIWITEESDTLDTMCTYLESRILSAYLIHACGQWSIKWDEKHEVSCSYSSRCKHQMIFFSHLPKPQWAELYSITVLVRDTNRYPVEQTNFDTFRLGYMKTLTDSNRKIDRRLQKNKAYIQLAEVYLTNKQAFFWVLCGS